MRARQLWHAEAGAGREGHTLLLCRKAFVLPVPLRSRIWISASQRFALYLDGHLLGRGPSRSDEDRWGVRCYPLDMGAGPHVLAAVVTHRGASAGKGQLGGPGFFLVAAEEPALEEVLGTASGWRSWHHRGWQAVPERAGRQSGHLAVGDGEAFSGEAFPWGWREPGFADDHWPEMRPVSEPMGNPWGNRIGGHHLRPDPLPEMLERSIAFQRPLPHWPIRIGAHSQWEQVFDVGLLTNAYLRLVVTGGKGARIDLVTCEAPVKPGGRDKGNRDEWEGKELPGMLDRFLPGGMEGEVFEPVWFRAFRYLRVTVQTGDCPVELVGLSLAETHFPLQQAAVFEPREQAGPWQRLMQITRRTALLCAHETTFDCPHYEQGQFGGDSRIQALYHYLVCDDDRLIRKCIDDLAASRVWMGLLRSHYPARFHQVIPTFSLHWIGMLHEFRQYRGDQAFIRPYLAQAREILAWFEARRRPDGLLGRIPYAPFIDWAFPQGNAPQDARGGSSLLTALFAQACQWMDLLEAFGGYPELRPRWMALGNDLLQAIRSSCLDPRTGWIRDTAESTSISLHGQTESALAGVFDPEEAARLLVSAIGHPEIRQPASFYYRHHVGMALSEAGAGEAVHALLEPWFDVLDGTGLTTLPENIERPRSDCHAWSVFSGIAPFTHLLGVQPDPRTAGMQRLIWDPHPGPLGAIRGELPTPAGQVHVTMTRSASGLEGTITSPVPVQVRRTGEWLPPGAPRTVQFG